MIKITDHTALVSALKVGATVAADSRDALGDGTDDVRLVSDGSTLEVWATDRYMVACAALPCDGTPLEAVVGADELAATAKALGALVRANRRTPPLCTLAVKDDQLVITYGRSDFSLGLKVELLADITRHLRRADGEELVVGHFDPSRMAAIYRLPWEKGMPVKTASVQYRRNSETSKAYLSGALAGGGTLEVALMGMRVPE